MDREDRANGAASDAATERLQLFDLCFFVVLALSFFVVAWLDIHTHRGDSIAYYDLSEAIRQHRWSACFNASWFPLYPALLALSRALFHFDPRYDAAAGRLLNFLSGLALAGVTCFLARTAQRRVLASGGGTRELVPRRALFVLVATVTFFFWAVDLGGEKPDTVLAIFLLLTTTFLIRGLNTASWPAFLVCGLMAGLAYWTKAFAFPYVCLLFFCVMLTQLRSRRALLQLFAAGLVFLAVAAPYIEHISAAKHRFTIGDSGRLNSVWYVNGAERLNPINNRDLDPIGSGTGTYLHPAELLAISPEIVYFQPGRVFGSMPAWDDFSYWSDGLAPRVSPRQTLAAIKVNLHELIPMFPLRFQATAGFAVLWIFGLRWRRRADPVLLACATAGCLSILLYLMVHFEGRYVVFAFLICAALLAASASAPALGPAPEPALSRKLYQTLLVLGLVIIGAEVQTSLRALRTGPAGDQPSHLRFDTLDYNIGQELRTRYGPGSQVACMGQQVCYDDAMWSWYGRATVSSVIALPLHAPTQTVQELCSRLHRSEPDTLNALRNRQVRAIVTYFGTEPACDAEWQPIAGAAGYYLRPL